MRKKANSFYVVTRDGRRIESVNYTSKSAASERARSLYEMLKHWGDSDADKINVVSTARPNQIR